ncbi:MAG: hypothetical protein JWM80_5872 [Cyanobacteria bacterium RYN_339]|nr:hypothetical protein [Cyanobacteria bacterium RYN_339]
MAISMQEIGPGMVELKASGTVTGADYDVIVPRMEQLFAAAGSLRVLVDCVEYKGMTLEAVWDKLAFALHHHGDVRRVAVVGNHDWEGWLVKLGSPLFGGELRYFDYAARNKARAWLAEGVPAKA